MSGPQGQDVRMRGFHQRTEVAHLVRLIEDHLRPLPAEPVDVAHAAERVLAEDVTAPVPVPGFDRAAMDGYALVGSETLGATTSAPREFMVIGDALPARPFAGRVGPGQAVRVMTGAPLPEGADAVVQAEAAQEFSDAAGRRVRVSEAVAPGRHVGR